MENRIQWLDGFNEAMHVARSVAASVDRNGEILSLAGNTIMGERLQGMAAILSESLTSIDGTITQMIHEQAEFSANQIAETFGALLRSVSDASSGEDFSKQPTR